MSHKIEAALLLYAVFILQRIEFLGTSVGMLILLALLTKTLIRALIINRRISTKFDALSTYPAFILSFLYGTLFGLGSYSSSDLVPFVAPAIVWMLFKVNKEWRPELFIDARLIVSIVITIGYFLVVDTLTVLNDSSGALKKTFQYSNPNYSGFLLNLLTWLWLLNSQRKPISSFIFMSLATAAIMMTLSKTAYAIHILFIFVLLKKNFVQGILFFTAISLLAAPYLVELGYLDLLFDFFEKDLDSAIGHRAGLINSALVMAADNPLFGVGYGNFLELATSHYGAPIAVKTHNIILTLIAEAGAVGLLIWIISQTLLLAELFRIKLRLPMVGLVIFYLFALTHASGEQLSQLPLILGLIALIGRNVKTNRIH